MSGPARRCGALLVLTGEEVRRALPIRAAIEAMRAAFAATSAGQVVSPERAHLSIRESTATTLVMSAFVAVGPAAPAALAVKVVSLFDGNGALGLARTQAAVLALDPETGRPVALLEGAALTALRTAAASALATEMLAREDARTLALFGAGVQARAHVEAMLAVRPIERIWIRARDPARIDALVRALREQHGAHLDFLVADSARAALAQADIVCTTTTSSVPLFEDIDVRPGTHINAIGSFTPVAHEIPPETVARARVFVDSRAAASLEAGDLIQARARGLLAADFVPAEIGELLLGRAEGRGDERELTLFKSVGLAAQDAVAARRAVESAQQLGLGTRIDW